MSSPKRIAARYGLSQAEVSQRRFEGRGLTFLRAARLLFCERERSKRLAAQLLHWRPRW